MTLPPETQAHYRSLVETRVQEIIANARKDGREITSSDIGWLRRQLYKEITVYGTFYGPRRLA